MKGEVAKGMLFVKIGEGWVGTGVFKRLGR